MMTRGGIYQISNTVTGKRYVGSAKIFKRRWQQHLSLLNQGKHHSRHLQAAWHKYGPQAFNFTPILVCTSEDLIFYEQRALDTLQPEYNVCLVAGNSLGVKSTAERKAKISKRLTGRKLAPEHRDKVVAALTRWRGTDDARLVMVECGRRVGKSEGTKLAASARAKALCSDKKWLSDFVAKSVATRKGKPANISRDKVKARTEVIIKYNKTRTISDAMRTNMSNGQKKRANIERFEYNGETKTILEWCDEYGLDRRVLRARINMGWEMHDALTRPCIKKPRRSA